MTLTGVYTDEDECERSRGQVCPRHSRCENTRGSFKCVCDPGFKLDTLTTTCQGQCTYVHSVLVVSVWTMQ